MGADEPPEEDTELYYNTEEVLAYSKLECLGLVDEEVYSSEPFTTIGSKMSNVTEDGKIKKKVIREGYGEPPREGHEVTIQYNAYLEFHDEPFDSTYIRKKPTVFEIGGGKTIVGLDLAIRTMKTNEKAQFLLHYDYAYGKMGCLGRIPPESTVLFEVELLKYVNCEAITSFDRLTDEEKREFENVYKYAQALCLKAKDLVTANLKAAIKQYNIAASKLEYAQLKDYSDQELQQSLLLKIYTNLVVCYMKIKEPRKTCINANKVFNLVKKTDLKVPVKVYFNVAKAYRMLCEYDKAEKYLSLAKKIEPGSTTISEEQVVLERVKNQSEQFEKNLAKKMFS